MHDACACAYGFSGICDAVKNAAVVYDDASFSTGVPSLRFPVNPAALWQK